MHQVLFIDQDPNLITNFSSLLDPARYDILDASTFEMAEAALHQQRFELVLADLNIEGDRGLDLIRLCNEHQPAAVVVSLGEKTSIETLVSLMHLGVYDFIEKPVRPTDFQQAVEHALGAGNFTSGNSSQVRPQFHFVIGNLIAESPVMQHISNLIRQIAGSAFPVSLIGPPGTGKRFVAEALHEESERPGPFLTVDGRDLTEEQFVSSAKKGFLKKGTSEKPLPQQVEDGTLYIRHADRMPQPVQREVYNLLCGLPPENAEPGSAVPDIRVIFGARNDLELQADVGLFLPELYEKVSLFTIDLPSLSQRKSDILPLCQYLTNEIQPERQATLELEPAAAQIIEQFPWSGHAVELKEVMTAILEQSGEEIITIDHLPAELLATSLVEADATADDRDPNKHLHIKTVLREYQEQVFSTLASKTNPVVY